MYFPSESAHWNPVLIFETWRHEFIWIRSRPASSRFRAHELWQLWFSGKPGALAACKQFLSKNSRWTLQMLPWQSDNVDTPSYKTTRQNTTLFEFHFMFRVSFSCLNVFRPILQLYHVGHCSGHLTSVVFLSQVGRCLAKSSTFQAWPQRGSTCGGCSTSSAMGSTELGCCLW